MRGRGGTEWKAGTHLFAYALRPFVEGIGAGFGDFVELLAVARALLGRLLVLVGRFALIRGVAFLVHRHVLPPKKRLPHADDPQEPSPPTPVELRMALAAQLAHQRAKSGDTVIGWKLDRADRSRLLERFPPKFSETIADHVTLRSRVARDSELPCETAGEIVGRIDDDAGVEAMVVRIDGTTGRPDGSIYHITWSLGRDRHARESNDVIARLGWQPLEPIPIRLEPASFP